jgi:hypothetical protein
MCHLVTANISYKKTSRLIQGMIHSGVRIPLVCQYRGISFLPFSSVFTHTQVPGKSMLDV